MFLKLFVSDRIKVLIVLPTVLSTLAVNKKYLAHSPTDETVQIFLVEMSNPWRKLNQRTTANKCQCIDCKNIRNKCISTETLIKLTLSTTSGQVVGVSVAMSIIVLDGATRDSKKRLVHRSNLNGDASNLELTSSQQASE